MRKVVVMVLSPVLAMLGIAALVGIDRMVRIATFRAAAAQVSGVVAVHGRRVVLSESLGPDELQRASDALVDASLRRSRFLAAPPFVMEYADFVIDPSGRLSWTPNTGPDSAPPAAYAALLREVPGTHAGTVCSVGSDAVATRVVLDAGTDPAAWAEKAARAVSGIPRSEVTSFGGDVLVLAEVTTTDAVDPPAQFDLLRDGRPFPS